MVRQAILTPNWLKAKLPRDIRPVRASPTPIRVLIDRRTAGLLTPR